MLIPEKLKSTSWGSWEVSTTKTGPKKYETCIFWGRGESYLFTVTWSEEMALKMHQKAVEEYSPS